MLLDTNQFSCMTVKAGKYSLQMNWKLEVTYEVVLWSKCDYKMNCSANSRADCWRFDSTPDWWEIPKR